MAAIWTVLLQTKQQTHMLPELHDQVRLNKSIYRKIKQFYNLKVMKMFTLCQSYDN